MLEQSTQRLVADDLLRHIGLRCLVASRIVSTAQGSDFVFLPFVTTRKSYTPPAIFPGWA